MTPQPQNLITDDELLQYSLLWAEAHSADTDGLGTVHTRAREFEKAIRSRPAPSAPTREIRGFVMIDRQKDFSMWLQEHDATIRKDEREKVLEQFAIRVRREFAQDDDEEWYLSSYDFEDCLEELKNDE